MVRVYRNLHRKQYSVQEKIDGRWKVVAHVNSIYLQNANFKVSEAGRQRVIREQRKNVHAYVEGEVITQLEFSARAMEDSKQWDRISYNPYKYGFFYAVNRDHQKVERAEICHLCFCRVSKTADVSAYGVQ